MTINPDPGAPVQESLPISTIVYPAPVPAVQHVVNVKQSRDRAQYTRQQKGHSLILNLLLVGPLTMFVTTIYWSVSPNHYWHA